MVTKMWKQICYREENNILRENHVRIRDPVAEYAIDPLRKIKYDRNNEKGVSTRLNVPTAIDSLTSDTLCTRCDPT